MHFAAAMVKYFQASRPRTNSDFCVTLMEDRSIEEKLRSKNYKDRIEAYGSLESCWRNKNYASTHLLPLMAKETNVPALEVLLDAVVHHEDLRDLKPLLAFLGNPKTSLRKRLKTLVDRMAEQDVGVLCMELVEMCAHKNTKLALSAAETLKGLVGQAKPQMILPVLPALFKHADAGIRKEGLEIAVEIYKQVGDDVFGVLHDIKQIQINELREKCQGATATTPKVSTAPGNSSINKSNPVSSKPRTSTPGTKLAQERVANEDTRHVTPPSKEEEDGALSYFYDKYSFLKDKDWKKRLEGLEESLGSIKQEDPRTLNTFVYAHKESVFQISLKLLECMSMEKKDLVYAYCVKKVTEAKMKDAICDVLSKLDYDFVVSNLVSSLNGKNGKVFVELVGLLVHLGRPECVHIKRFLETCKSTGWAEKEAIQKLRDSLDVGACEASFSQLSIHPRSEDVEALPAKRETDNDAKNGTPKTVAHTDAQRRVSTPPLSTHSDRAPSPNLAPNAAAKPVRAPLKLTEKDILHPGISKLRIKNGKDVGKVFTKAFLALMEETDPAQVAATLNTIDMIPVSDFVIHFYLRHYLDIHPLIDYFVQKKYILKDYEAKLVLEHFIKAEIRTEIDTIYPVSKLFIAFQKLMHLNTEFVIERINALVLKYKFFRGDKHGYYNVLKSLGKDEFVATLIKVCPELLQCVNDSFLSPMPKRRNDTGGLSTFGGRVAEGASAGSFLANSSRMSAVQHGGSPDAQKHSRFDLYRSPTNGKGHEAATRSRASVQARCGVSAQSPSLASLDGSDSLCRSRIEQYRRDFEDEFSMPKIPNLITDDLARSREDFADLNSIIDNKVKSLFFSSNSLVNTIIIQLNTVREKGDTELFETIIRTLIKLTNSKELMGELSLKSLELLNTELIKLVKHNSLIGDVLINLCVNTSPVTILAIYLELISDEALKEICMKLIWRHSKLRNYFAETQQIIDLIFKCYEKNLYKISEDVILHKTCQLHLGELVAFHREKIFQFNLQGIIKEYVKNTLNKDADVRCLRDSIRRVRDTL